MVSWNFSDIKWINSQWNLKSCNVVNHAINILKIIAHADGHVLHSFYQKLVNIYLLIAFFVCSTMHLPQKQLGDTWNFSLRNLQFRP